MESDLQKYLEWFTPLDRAFARFMLRLAGEENPELCVASLLVSHRTGRGDVCLDLPFAAGRPLSDFVEMEGEGFALPGKKKWISSLRKSPVVSTGGDRRPLVMDERGRLYLYRYYLYEKILAGEILERSALAADDVDLNMLDIGLSRIFTGGSGSPDRQRIAAMTAVLRRFCVISGGPGTGKTSTVAKILVLLAEQFLARGKQPLIALTAPTGKAARRLQEAVGDALAQIPCDENVRSSVPLESSTVHRLLGSITGSPYFRRNREDPLPHDVVVVDETSMADLPLLAKLFQAIRPGARVILIGDRDQLSSVESGAAFGDICAWSGATGDLPPGVAAEGRRTREKAAKNAKAGKNHNVPPMVDSLVVLETSYRFGLDSGIGKLAASVRRGDGHAALDILSGGDYPDLGFRGDVHGGNLRTRLEERILQYLEEYISVDTPEKAIGSLGRFVILAAMRKGPFGVEHINRMAEHILAERGFADPRKRWYHGRPLIISANDYALRLYNGDMGVAFKDGTDGRIKAFFLTPEGSVKTVPTPLLPPHETAYSLTVHKSQGSEFDRVLLVLPEKHYPLLTRELIYTGITRARLFLEIWSSPRVFETSVMNKTARASGLRDRIWGVKGEAETHDAG